MKESEAFYEAKLILENLLPEDLKLIPSEAMKFIDKHSSKPDSVSVDLNIPLEKQEIDIKIIEILNEILNLIPEQIDNEDIKFDYKSSVEELKKKLKEIEKTNSYLSKENELLKNKLNLIPKFIKKIFIKEEKHLLLSKKEE